MEDSKVLAIVEERTRMLPGMDKRLREIAEEQSSMRTEVSRNRDDIKEICNDVEKVDDKVDSLKIWDRIWNGANSLVLAVLIYLMTGQTPK